MKLSEEIAALMCERYCGIGVMALPEYLPADVEIAEELVNKILDAAVEAVDQMYKDIVFHQDHVYRCLLARCRTKKDAIEAINKLRRD